ncbi:MAG: glycosyltransferase family 4 protein [Solirubrobacteraceae bacterium]
MGASTLLAATPVAIAVANRTDFLDHPREYRQHAAPTPLLGGAAVLLAVMAGAAAVGDWWHGLGVLLACALAMWAIGTADDRVAVAPRWRLLAASAAAAALYASGHGWDTAAGGVANFLLTLVWVVGLVNAFNLMDNIDGACCTVAAASATGIAVLAGIHGDTHRLGLACALATACAGFLLWNLSRPSRIFLGDGGSMSIGFLVAALAMATARHAQAGNAGILVGALLAGLPILDVGLVSLSRTRRGVPLVTGGRDHLTHRLLLMVRTPRRVAAFLAATQALLCAFAVAGSNLGTDGVAGFGLAAFVAGVISILVLDTERWRPAGIATRETLLAAASESTGAAIAGPG